MSFSPQLTFVEELVLLALDDATGARRPVAKEVFALAVAGALVCDLLQLKRIDADVDEVFVLSTQPTQDPILDPPLSDIVASAKAYPVSHWLTLFAEQSQFYQSAASDRLVERGILRREDKKLLWAFSVRRYPTVQHQPGVEVRTRLSALLLGDELPDPRDTTLVSLLEACRLTEVIFPGPEFKARSARRASVARMDLVGREVAATYAKRQAVNRDLPVDM